MSNDGNIAQSNGIDIWYETFGNKTDPALLLIMGGLGQGILWPTEFCRQLAGSGFFVIRYDHRDAGYSTCFDFEKAPYNLLDMAKDAVGLLDYLKISKAHLCGLSMGGPIAELISVHYPERVLTLTLIATSCDLRPSSLAYDEQYPVDITLSRPKKIYLDWMHQFLKFPPQSFAEQVRQRVECWRILNGSVVPFDEQQNREMHSQFLVRMRHPESLTNHLVAIKNSFEMIQSAPLQVKAPTLIIHGSEDPIFPPDHGEALSKLIPQARYLFVKGLGHIFGSYFYGFLVQEINQHVKS